MDSHVAVIWLGGLGHLAMKLAKALGAHVTLFTRSPARRTIRTGWAPMRSVSAAGPG